MNRRLRVFFAALLICCTYIPPPVPVCAEGAEIAGGFAALDDEAAVGSAERFTENGVGIPEDARQNAERNAASIPPGISAASEAVEEPLEINRVMIDDMSLYFLRAGDSAQELLSQLETHAYAFFGYKLRGQFAIDWQIAALDTITPGRYTVTGRVVLTEEYVFSDGELTVESTVIVYDDGGAPHIRVTKCKYTTSGAPVILPLGASESEVEEAFDSATGYKHGIATCHTEYGDVFSAPFALDLSVIDTATPGAYYPVKVELPGGMTCDGGEFWSIAAHVVPEDEVTLGAIRLWDVGYIVQWAYLAEDPELWSSVDGGQWQRQADPPGSGWHDYGKFLDPDTENLNGLVILFACLEPGHVYRFQVQYDGSRFSEVLVLDFTDSDIPRVTSENGGDRTGGDRGESDPPPDNGQPPTPPTDPPDSGQPPTPSTDPPDSGQPPTPPTDPPDSGQLPTPPTGPPDSGQLPMPPTGLPVSGRLPTPPDNSPGGGQTLSPLSAGTNERGDAPSQSAAVVTIGQAATPLANLMSKKVPAAPEYPQEDSGLTVTGGSLLAMMTSNPNYVTLLHDRMSASIPIGYLRSLSVTDSDSFSVRLEKPEEYLFSVSFLLNQTELTGPFAEPFLVGIPWEGGEVSCALEQDTIANASLSGGKAVFALYQTGTYRLKLADRSLPVSADVQEKPQVQAFAGADARHPQVIGTAEPDEPYRDSFALGLTVCYFAFAGAVAALRYLLKRRVRL